MSGGSVEGQCDSSARNCPFSSRAVSLQRRRCLYSGAPRAQVQLPIVASDCAARFRLCWPHYAVEIVLVSVCRGPSTRPLCRSERYGYHSGHSRQRQRGDRSITEVPVKIIVTVLQARTDGVKSRFAWRLSIVTNPLTARQSITLCLWDGHGPLLFLDQLAIHPSLRGDGKTISLVRTGRSSIQFRMKSLGPFTQGIRGKVLWEELRRSVSIRCRRRVSPYQGTRPMSPWLGYSSLTRFWSASIPGDIHKSGSATFSPNRPDLVADPFPGSSGQVAGHD